MPILLTDRRGIFYEQPGRGELQVLHVSPGNQRTVLKDLQGTETRHEVATRAGITEQVPLWRVVGGQVTLYGTLGRNLTERVQAARVWLAEDFAPKDCTVFYFVFGRAWVVHGRREKDDEGHNHWRVTALAQKGDADIARLIRNSLNDQMMLSEETNPCVAVHNDAPLMEVVNRELESLGQKAIAFAALRPAPSVRPLHTQRNNTLIYLTLLFVMLLAMVASVVYTLLGVVEERNIENRIADLKVQIAQIAINKRIGYIREPQPVLDVIKQTFNQQPSAIMDAATRIAALYGALDSVDFAMPDSNIGAIASDNRPVVPLEKGQYVLYASTSSTDKQLLVAQEAMTKELVSHMPWLRVVENISGKGQAGLKLRLTLQVESSPLTQGQDDQEGAAR